MHKKRVGLIGARGHTGAQLIPMLARHTGVELASVSSRELAGEAVSDHIPDAPAGLRFEALAPEDVAALDLDAVILALPNGVASRFVEAIDSAGTQPIMIDLSADRRFDADWIYGLPERNRDAISTARRIANPGCYATGMQLALLPFVDRLASAPSVFGVSGYSGAGTTPSPKNDPEVLRDNILPYALTGHIHEREVSHQLAHPVVFMPHVAPFFRGITLTIACELTRPLSPAEAFDLARSHYENEALITVSEEIPLVRDAALTHRVNIGGFATTSEGRLTLVATLDNLLKGAATQAMQNLNLAMGFSELEGVLQ
ncbi:N-acetyl-gamma-glutamyl-phosphate reductase [Bradymonadaceae bacterium TMQ3]|nr:N-acetyl-gamma-glutamyl-phosphate reductase [Bradymonadaceae bacterium TMQ3]TXC76601.1 N-acetyl-gamma-glutamyl-phosphate reductase [Bradymonadales bacterium TMQ1]